jgi:hypothetical protein
VIFSSILERDPVPVARLNPDLPAELERIMPRRSRKIVISATSMPPICALTSSA